MVHSNCISDERKQRSVTINDPQHLTIDELTMIESYYLQHNKPVEIANRMGRAIQTIYNIVNKFKQGKTALDYWHQYKENKKNVVEKSFNYLLMK